MRTPIFAANWKMNMTGMEAQAWMADFAPRVADAEDVEIVVAPPFTALERVAGAARGTRIRVAAQNVSEHESGAFTGEIAAPMLRDLGCDYTLVGHSERRTLFGESSGVVAQKAEALLASGIRPIVCVGETLEEREGGRTSAVVERQLAESLAAVGADDAGRVVVAYEPVWAIGTGRTATPEVAQEVHGIIRAQLASLYAGAADDIRIQYGGSVKPANAAALMAQPDIDGALVGGASLDPASFATIARSARDGRQDRCTHS